MLSRHEIIALALALVIGSVLSLRLGTFLTKPNLLNIARTFSWIAIAAFGESIVIVTGGIDMSVGAVMALAGLVSVMGMKAGLPVTAAIAAGLLVGVLVGWINGVVVGRVRLPPFIVTLGTMSIVRGIIFGLSGGWSFCVMPAGFRMLGQHTLSLGPLPLPLPVIIMLALATLLHLFMRHTVLGNYIYTLGNSERALVSSGVNVAAIRVLVYILCGALAATGGLLMTARLGVAAPTAATGYELDIIAAAVIGGTSLLGGEGSIPGVLLGAAILGILHNGLVLSGFSGYWGIAANGTMNLIFILLDRWRRQREDRGL
jgi:ribose transport system permease protein